MELDVKRTNLINLRFHCIYIVILFAILVFDHLSGSIPFLALVGFLVLSFITYGILFIVYFKDKNNIKLKYNFAVSLSLIYLYVMLIGHTEFRFAIIFPPLCLLILYHSTGFMIGISVISALINILNVLVCVFVFKRTESSDYIRYFIQIFTILGTSLSSLVASLLYKHYYIKNLEQNNQLSLMSLQTIETIANTIDAKDPYTQGHSRRVADYSAIIAKRLGYNDEEIGRIKYIALLHDVGKIAVPDSVLNKPFRLTKSEYALMQIHTTEGAEILKDITVIPDIALGAKYHHERIDGNGYPEGLKGDEIPMVARIIGLADAFDAMTSNRVYRKPLPNEDVITEIITGRGTQFDEKCVDVFLEYLKERKDNFSIVSAQPAEIPNSKEEDNKSLDLEKYDDLTGAFNEEYGLKFLSSEINQRPGTLLVFNIVGLKNINYELGYQVGDYYLKNVADTLIRCRTHPPVVRHRGTDFLVYFESTNRDETTYFVRDCFHRIAALEENDPLMEETPSMTCAAITITEYNNTLEDLLEDLEKVLYSLKESKNNFAFFEAPGSKAISKSQEKDLELLLKAISEEDPHNIFAATGINNKNIANIIDLIKQKKDEEIGIMLFTIKPVSDYQDGIKNVGIIQEILRDGLNTVIKKRGLVSSYSSLQQLAILFGSMKYDKSWDEYTDLIKKETLSFFHKNYDKIDVEIECSVEVIKQNVMDCCHEDNAML